jgi:hypothetical protein
VTDPVHLLLEPRSTGPWRSCRYYENLPEVALQVIPDVDMSGDPGDPTLARPLAPPLLLRSHPVRHPIAAFRSPDRGV